MSENPQKIVFVNPLSPGDVLIMSVAIRSLHKAYPGEYLTDVRSPCNEIFLNSPYITPINCGDPAAERNAIEELKKDEQHPPIEVNGVKYIIAHYPEISKSSMTGLPFADGHRMFLEKQLKVSIPRTGMQPDIFLSPFELNQPNVLELNGHKDVKNFWIINAGIKDDYTLKYYPYHQKVVDLLKDKITFVQVGLMQHNHPALNGVIDLRGKTNLRQLFRLANDADGAICAVSLQMVIQAALKKPCVVISGAREGVRWQLNPDHMFLYRNGAMSCASYDGCWKSKKEDCINKHPETANPMCMELIAPEEVARAVELYYLGGRLKSEKIVTATNMPKLEMKEVPQVETVLENDTNTDAGWNNFDKTITFTANEKKNYMTSAIFNTLRILKKINPNDQYYEAYMWHLDKNKVNFMDSYHIMWWIGSNYAPSRILEIGSRTGISICQLLSSYIDYKWIQEVTLCDIFAEIGSPEVIKRNLEYLNIPTNKVNFVTGDSLAECPKLITAGKKYDYILVDGNHDKEYARQDLANAVKLIDIGGFILFDDITPDGCSLQDVWEEFKYKHPDLLYIEDHNGKGIGVARRVK